MGRLDREIQPSGEVGSEYIYCRVWWQDPEGEGGAASDWRRQHWGGADQACRQANYFLGWDPNRHWHPLAVWPQLPHLRMGACVLPQYGDF